MSNKKSTVRPIRKIAGIILSLATVTSAYAGFGIVDNSFVSTKVSAAEDYGLMDTCQEGVILHAWQWSFNNIKANMKQIAEAGYTSIQTSVIQQAKEATKGKTNEMWWVYYQPAQFKIDNTGTSALGTKDEFAAMCEEAHKYGIHVIVDVVANHLGNQTKYDISSAVPGDIRNDPNCWHSTNFNSSDEINYDSRYSITHGSMGGLPDLNTENAKIQTYVINYLKECIDSGADGFRFDAAKHISIDTEGSEYTFWPNVINAAKSYYKTNGHYDSLYCYGEILGGLSGSATVAAYNKYMSVTDDSTGNTIRKYVNSGNTAGAARSDYDKGVSADNLVLWAESHDTYSNEAQETTYISTSVINRTWALVASRNKASALYFARTNGYRKGDIGTIYSKECFSKEVVEVNKFHNRFNGQTEYLSYSGNIAYNERGTSGVVLVNIAGGSASVNVTANKMAAGTYIDHITGNKFTVANGKISGTIGSTGIAVVYDSSLASVYAAPADGTSFDDTLEVTLKSSGVTSGSYSTSEGASGTFKSGDKITVGSKTAVGKYVTVTLTGTGSDGSTATSTYKYYKRDPDAVVKVYFDNTSYGWDSVYAYVYTANGTSVISNGEWPGEAMTYNKTKDLYELQLSDKLVNSYVIFTEKADSTTNRYPADGDAGMQVSGASMIFGKNHSWELYKDDDNTGSVSASPATGTSFTGDTLEVTLKSHNVTSAKYTTSEGASGTYSSGDKITVGSKTNAGSSVTVTLTGTNSDGSTVTEKYVYTKKDASQQVKVYFDNTSYKWSKVYAYIYDESGTKVIQNGDWPGVAMTFDKESGYYAIDVDDTLVNGNVIFTESQSATTNRYPADKEKGMQLSGSSMLFGADYSWTVYSDVPDEMQNTSKLSSDKIKLGETVDILAGYTGGAGDVEYAVYYKRVSENDWATAQSYSSQSKVTIKPKYATVFDVCVKAKDRKGTVVKKYLELFVSSATNADFTNLSKISSHTVPLGQSVTVTCANEGGKNVKYSVFYKQTTSSSWTTAKKNSSDTSVTIKPKYATPYYVCVTAKDDSGNVAKLYMNLTVTANANSTLSNTSSVSKTSVKVNEVITLKGSCTGGKGTKKYAFYDKLTTESKYTTIQSYSTGSSTTLKFGAAGKYKVSICVRDSTNAVAKKYFTITVK